MQATGYKTEVHVHRMKTRELLENYRNPQDFLEACQLCPNYGKVWSCPPDLPDAYGYLEPYEQAFVIAVKVVYTPETLARVKTSADAEQVRQETYERVKKQLLLTLLNLEKELKKGKCLGAGRCILCGHCTREDGRSCRYPERRRYSVTGFGFDFTKILQEIFKVPLLWNSEGLPEYDVAVTIFAI